MKFKDYFAFCILIGLSSGAPSDFVGFPALSTALESATGSFSDLFDRLLSSLIYIIDTFHPLKVLNRNLPNVIQTLASLALNPTKTTTSSSDGQARAEEEPEDIITDDCFFKTNNVDAGVCPAGCYMWALQGKCWCPRSTKDDCETKKHCYWLVAEGKCIHGSERFYGVLASWPNTTTSTSDRIAQNLNGGARVEEEPKESCRFKMSNSNALTGCPADCATLFPAIPGQCLCPRNTKDDCETDKGCHWSVDAQTEGKCIHQMDRLYNALFKKLDKRGNTTEVTHDPNFDQDFTYAFSIALSPVAVTKNPNIIDIGGDTEDSSPKYKAYSIAISPVAAAGLSATGEFGLAVDGLGQVLLFASLCTGLKADISLEADIVLGHWFNINDVIGSTWALGIGGDLLNVGKAVGTRERGANFELIFNPTDDFIGATFSVGYGKGPQLPVDFEVNFDTCDTFEVYRFNIFKLIFQIIDDDDRVLLINN